MLLGYHLIETLAKELIIKKVQEIRCCISILSTITLSRFIGETYIVGKHDSSCKPSNINPAFKDINPAFKPMITY